MEKEQEKSHISLFIETNVSQRVRSAFYSLPLLINWAIGIGFETNAKAWRSARRGFFLSIFFLFINAILFFSSGFFQYFIKEISDYLFFVLSTINIMAYFILSLYISWQAWNDQENSWIEHKTSSMEKYLSR